MMQRANAHSSLFLAGIIALALAYGGLLGSWSYSDKSFQNGFEAALSDRIDSNASVKLALSQVSYSEPAASAAAISSPEPSNARFPVSGSEEFWLGQTKYTGITPTPVALNGPFKLGGHVTIGATDTKRVWTVVNISELKQPVTASSRGAKPSILLVTLQDQSPRAISRPLMRIIVDMDDLPAGLRVSSAPLPATL